MNTNLTPQQRREQLMAAEIAKLAALYRREKGLDDPLPATPNPTCRDLIGYLIAHEGLSSRLPLGCWTR